MALCTVLLFSVSWSAVLHEGLGLPVISQSAAHEPEPAHKQRTKRCSCNNLLDSECHYFCHLDIIWVNTPSKITVYGLGSPMARRRRSTDRCLCANPADQICNSFCLHSPDNASVMLKSLSEPVLEKAELLKSDLQKGTIPGIVVIERAMDLARGNAVTFLRNLMRTKSRAMKIAAPDRKIAERVHKPGYR